MGKNYLYFHDFFGENEAHIHGVERILYETRTPYQLIQVAESPIFGKMLIIDGDVQSTSIDEYIYHESLVHPAMLISDEPKVALIIGGGEGATLREVLKHKSIRKAIMIDIDKDAVEVAKQYLPEWHKGAFSDSRANIINVDARKFLESDVSLDSMDVVISDLTEPYDEGPSYKLFTKEFFRIIMDKLKENGTFVLQASMLRVTAFEMHKSIKRTLEQVFPIVRSYFAYVPSFDTTWSFVLATKKNDPKEFTKEEIDSLISKRINGELKFYDGETHISIFNLPKDIRELLKEGGEIITDDKPIFLKRK